LIDRMMNGWNDRLNDRHTNYDRQTDDRIVKNDYTVKIQSLQ